MKSKKSVSMIVAAVLFAAVLIISAVSPKKQPEPTAAKQTAATPSQAQKPVDKTMDDMRGVWVTYMDLSMENEADKSETGFRQKFEAIASTCKSYGLNTLVVQVRPFGDALYPSKLYPASHILSGKQGKSAGYDALQIICDVCHSHGLKLHAWVNPYRVTAGKTPAELSADNPYLPDKSMGIQTESGIILDPSNEKARKLIVDGVREIVENYDVDGIQFDDYFYPTDIGDADSAQYAAYLKTVPKKNAMDLATWRSFNVSMLIAETYMCVHQCSDAVFGVSPQGNLGNNAQLSADVVHWCGIKGFLDYICPQIYFSPDNPHLGFEAALNDWTALDYADGVRLFVGLAGYKAGTDADEGTWLDSDTILTDEYNILKKNNKISGFMLYSYASLNDETARAETENLKQALQPASSPSQ